MTKISIKPNLQLIYVSDIKRSTTFYQKLFTSEPVFTSPRYVAFSASKEALFALWTGGKTPDLKTPRFSEIGILLPSSEHVDQLYEKWQNDLEINIIQKPVTEIFGRTFLVQDPDGHTIRVCPVD